MQQNGRPVCSIDNLAYALHECRYIGGLAASGGQGAFGYARFTRDYLQAMSDVMSVLPSVAREGFSLIPQEQGVKFDALTEEEADRLPHQVAQGMPSGLVVPPKVVEGWREYLEKWDVPYDERYGFIVYNATDGVRYLVELAEYCRRYGREVLDDRFEHRTTGEMRTVAEAALRLVGWMMATIRRSEECGVGLLEVKAYNPRQTSWSGVMRDGMDAYFHPEGEVGAWVNREEPVAYIENQGLAVGALKAAAELFPEHEQRSEWLELARALPRRTVELFWMPEHRYFAPAIDRDEDGEIRQVKLLSSAPMELMATPFFDELPNRRELIEALVERVFDPGFLTPVGVRMLHLDHAGLEHNYYAYQGTGAVWGVTQRLIAHGLRRQGFTPLAHNIGLERLVAGLNRTGKLVEFWYVEREHGWVNYHPYEPPGHGELVMNAAARPTQPQLWTITGAIAELLSQEAHMPVPAEGSWERQVSDKYLGRLGGLAPAVNDDANEHAFDIDVVRGRQILHERVQKMTQHSRSPHFAKRAA
jgi:hypothetical protein